MNSMNVQPEPIVDAFLQGFEGQGAAEQDDVVKFTQVELIGQLLF